MVLRRFLQIPINTIQETGRTLSLDLSPEWFAHWGEKDPGLEFSSGQLTGSVHLERHGHDILVRGHLSGYLSLTCSRCLDLFGAPVAADFDLLLVPGPEDLSPEEELSAQDLDLDFYSGEVVDLESILREQIILMVPLKPLCTETCAGLCPHCGANLNRETCTCKEEKLASPLAELARLKT
jgi:uncharacterized protein